MAVCSRWIIMAYETQFTPFEGKETVGNLTTTDGNFSFTASVNLDVQATLDDYKGKMENAHANFTVGVAIDLTKITNFLNKK